MLESVADLTKEIKTGRASDRLDSPVLVNSRQARLNGRHLSDLRVPACAPR